MRQRNVRDRVLAIMRGELGDESIGLDTDLVALGCDSLDQIMLVMELEDEFEISIPDAKTPRQAVVRLAEMLGVELTGSDLDQKNPA